MKKSLVVFSVILFSVSAFGQHQFGAGIGARTFKYSPTVSPHNVEMRSHISGTANLVFRYQIKEDIFLESGFSTYSNYLFFRYKSNSGYEFFDAFSLAVERGIEMPVNLVYRIPLNKTYNLAISGGFGVMFNRKSQTDNRVNFGEANGDEVLVMNNPTTTLSGSNAFLGLGLEGQINISENLVGFTRLKSNLLLSPMETVELDLVYTENSSSTQTTERARFKNSQPSLHLVLGFRYNLMPQ